MGDKTWFSALTEDDTDPSTPLFWETVHWLAKQGLDLSPPKVELGPASLGVQVLELQRQVAIKTPTMAMEIIE
jgi:hypothetical protein